MFHGLRLLWHSAYDDTFFWYGECRDNEVRLYFNLLKGKNYSRMQNNICEYFMDNYYQRVIKETETWHIVSMYINYTVFFFPLRFSSMLFIEHVLLIQAQIAAIFLHYLHTKLNFTDHNRCCPISGGAVLRSNLADGRFQVQSPVVLFDLDVRSFPWFSPKLV